MFRSFSMLVAAIALLLTTGWLTLSDQTGTPLSISEFIQQLTRLSSQALDRSTPVSSSSPATASSPVLSSSPATHNQASSPDAALEQAIHDRVNQYRVQKGLSPLTLDARISQPAREHSRAMASGEVPFSHDGFDQRIETIARSIPYRTAAENVAYNQGYREPVAQAVEGWINSPGHRVNMEGNFDLTGVGVARTADGKYYFTQIFIRRLL
jgi:uncharacterized protein YkwD